MNLFRENRDRAAAILMDIKMPVMTGLDATVIIRKENQNIPISCRLLMLLAQIRRMQ